MGDMYQELLIKKEKTGADTLKKAGLIFLVILLAGAGLFIRPIFLLAALGMAIASFYLMQSLDLEYEYLYVNGDLDIDKIMNKTRRKKAASFDLANLEILAPAASHSLDAYVNKRDVRCLDFSSGNSHAALYKGVYHDEKGMQIVVLELSSDILEDMRRRAPRKVER